MDSAEGVDSVAVDFSDICELPARSAFASAAQDDHPLRVITLVTSLWFSKNSHDIDLPLKIRLHTKQCTRCRLFAAQAI